ncbi:MlaD family protein [Hymenobacter nivis]|uniref:MlaD family protein n=1 Tax=Hymenobacter nivis TaxID=1850093 RepID=UPI001375D50C|nr:MlaD family protein [Hymenobacter nivis]
MLSKEIKVGVLALVAIVVLFVGFNYLRGSNVLSSSHTYFAKYASVDGLNIGAPVVFNGIKVGQVKNLELLPEEGNKVKATMELEKGIVVGDSTVASLAGSLLGTKTITLFMGKNSKTFSGGEELKSYTVASITDAFQAKALPMLGTVDSTLNRVNGFLNKDAKTSIQATLLNAQGSSEALKNLIIQNQRNINEITTNMARLTRALNGSTGKLDRIAGNFSQLSDSLKSAPVGPALRRMNATMAEAQATVTSLNKALNDKSGSIGMLLNDSSLYRNLNASTASTNALLVDFKENPKRYVHFSVFGGGKDKTKKETTKSPDGTVTTETKKVETSSSLK